MDNNSIRILLVDDDEDDYVITRELLSEIEGTRYVLEWVDTFDAAPEAIRRNQHDVYLFDYRLGERNGLELLREAVKNGCKKPIIILTGQGDREVDIVAVKAGAADYLEKSQINASLLERSIRYAIERKRIKEETEEAYKRLEEQSLLLAQTEKMRAIGTLIAGVAHELNNPIMGILNFTQYCLKHTSEDDRRYSILQDIEYETKRCADIVQNLLTFSHMGKGEKEEYRKEGCNVIFERVFKLLSYRVEKQHVSVNYHIPQGTPEIWMRGAEIQEVFLNILSNALDALEGSDKRDIHINVHHEGEFVVFTIADSGCGIAPENIGKIFDPFFTTKPVGKGTGLGLSICQSIIKKHGGEITCESVLGVGTTFKILLPIKAGAFTTPKFVNTSLPSR